MYTRKDFILSVITGAVTGLIAALIFDYLNKTFVFQGWVIYGCDWYLLIAILPILWLMGTYILGYKLSKLFPFMFQFSKFVAVGFLNTAADFGVLNLLIYLTDVTKGLAIVGLKSASFIVAVVNSYFWNKFWSFKEKSEARFGQFLQFTVVIFIGWLINVGIVYFGSTYIVPFPGIDSVTWVNIVNMASVVISLFWNFIGLKFIVFKDKDDES